MADCLSCGGPRPARRGRQFCVPCSAARKRESQRRHRHTDKCRATARAYAARTKEKQREYRERYWRKHGERLRPAMRERNKAAAFASALESVGLTESEYASLADLGCALCGGVDTRGYRLAIDHDHTTGAFRGLLCGSCNTRLGWYERRVDAIRDYLLGGA